MIPHALLPLLLANSLSLPPVIGSTPLASEASATNARPAEATGAFFDLEFDAARALAKKEGKLVMIDFYTTWCGPCKKLDAVTWPDPGVQRWLLDNVIAIKVDAESDIRTSSIYQVDLYPSLVFLKSDGLELDRLKGFLDPQQFLSSARMLIAAAENGPALAQRATGPELLVPSTRLAYANYLAGTLRYRESAEHYLWCFDEGAKHDEDFQATRRGEVLDGLTQISRTWFRGKKAITERRDAALARVMSEAGTAEDALDLAALNASLKRNSDTLASYIALIEGEKPQLEKARALLDPVFEQLIGPKRYAEIVKCQPDFSAKLDERLGEYTALASRYQSVPRAKEMLAMELSGIVTRGTLYFEVLLATGASEQAETLAKRLTQLDSAPRTYLAVARRAKRTGDLKAALQWAKLGFDSVPEEQRSSLEVMVKSLEREVASQPGR